MEATKKGGEGVFENALGAGPARNAYSANKSSIEILFGSTGSTRYGVIAKQTRLSPDPDTAGTPDTDDDATPGAVHKLRFAFDGSDVGAEDVGELGAFAYSTEKETIRSRKMPQTGSATYEGGTVAVTPDASMYRGDIRLDVNFRTSGVFGRISELKDEDGDLWQYLDRDVAEIYLPRRFYDFEGKFGGTSDTDVNNAEGMANEDMFGDATIVYTDTHGFPLPTQVNDKSRSSGRFSGATGTSVAGVWSLGQSTPVDSNGNDTTDDGEDTLDISLDIIYGAYGAELAGQSGLPAPSSLDGTSGGQVATAVKPSDVTLNTHATAGTLRLGRRNNGTAAGALNDFKVKDIFAKPATEGANSMVNPPTWVDIVVAEIEKQRDLYNLYSIFDDVTDREASQNAGRQAAWAAINAYVRQYIFGFDATVAVLELPGTPGTDPDTNATSAPLRATIYPVTRNDLPDDTAANARIDDLIDALTSGDNLEAALKDFAGGVFDSQPVLSALTGTLTAEEIAEADPFPTGTIETGSAIFNQAISDTKVWTMSTDYTRFGVWYRTETTAANAKPMDHSGHANGAASPGGYAYSWLSQSSYRRDRVEQTYPASGIATYTGTTLAILNTDVFMGDAEVRVTWDALPEAADGQPTSTVLPKFSNLRNIANNDPLRRGSQDPTDGAPIVEEIAFLGAAESLLQVNNDAGGMLGVTADGSDVIARLSLSTRTGADSTTDVESTTDNPNVFDAAFVWGES